MLRPHVLSRGRIAVVKSFGLGRNRAVCSVTPDVDVVVVAGLTIAGAGASVGPPLTPARNPSPSEIAAATTTDATATLVTRTQ
jgi:hypothetical protein